MANKHYRNWIIQMPLGFVFTTGAIFILMYTAKKAADEHWIILTMASAGSLIIGLILVGNGVIHKVKSDLIRKSKKRHSSSTVVEEE